MIESYIIRANKIDEINARTEGSDYFVHQLVIVPQTEYQGFAMYAVLHRFTEE